MEITITQKQAAKLALANDKWLITPFKNGSVQDTLKIIKQLGHIQIDTISVIARAHHHILWTRNHGYTPEHIDHLQTNGKHIFEYWAHAAAYLPIKAYQYCLPEMKRIKKNGHSWYQQNIKLMQAVKTRVKKEGPLSTINFEHLNNNNQVSWGSLKPAKHALENLFMGGELAITRRDKFRKVYDLAERVYPKIKSLKSPSQENIIKYLIKKAANSLGIFSIKDILYLKKKTKDQTMKIINQDLESEKLIEIHVKGINQIYYIQTAAYKKLTNIKIKSFVRILSPFDNQVVNRQRLLEIFGFSYSLECYLPASKRKYGYFALPILSNNGFIGTIDLKADRKSKIMLIKQVNFNTKLSKIELINLNKELKTFARFNNCELEKILMH